MRIPTDSEHALLVKFLEYYRLYQKDHSRDMHFSPDYGDFENICSELGLAVRVLPQGRIELPVQEQPMQADEAFEELCGMHMTSLRALKLKKVWPKEKVEKQFADFVRFAKRALGLERDAVKREKDLPWKKRKVIRAKTGNISAEIRKLGLKVFIDPEGFERWLFRKLPKFEGEKPIDVIQHPYGSGAVKAYLEELLGIDK